MNEVNIYVRFRWLETIEDVSPIQSNYPKRLQAPIAKLNSNDRGSRTLGVVPRGPTYHSISTTSTKRFRLSLLHVARYGKRAARAPLGVGGRKGGRVRLFVYGRHGVWSPPSAANPSQCQLTVRILSVGKARCFAYRGLDPRSNFPEKFV